MMQTGKTPFVSFDYKEAAVERERLSQALDGYACFGWELDRQEGAGGQIRLFLRRDRHILNKAELTRLERQFEACLDAIRALEASVPQRAAMAALAVGLAGTVFLAGATFAVTAAPPVVWLCAVLAVPGFLGWGGAYPVYRRARSVTRSRRSAKRASGCGASEGRPAGKERGRESPSPFLRPAYCFCARSKLY